MICKQRNEITSFPTFAGSPAFPLAGCRSNLPEAAVVASIRIRLRRRASGRVRHTDRPENWRLALIPALCPAWTQSREWHPRLQATSHLPCLGKAYRLAALRWLQDSLHQSRLPPHKSEVRRPYPVGKGSLILPKQIHGTWDHELPSRRWHPPRLYVQPTYFHGALRADGRWQPLRRLYETVTLAHLTGSTMSVTRAGARAVIAIARRGICQYPTWMTRASTPAAMA